MPWNPERYHQFQKERSAPFDDLLQLVQRREGRASDQRERECRGPAEASARRRRRRRINDRERRKNRTCQLRQKQSGLMN